MKNWVDLINKIKLLEQTFQTLRMGSRGPLVKQLQSLLGFPENQQDSIFGNATRQAVLNFQKQQGLSQDGIVGPNTWEKLSGTNIAPTTQPTAKPLTTPTVTKSDARTEPGFTKNLSKVANNIGTDSQNLMTVFKHESGFNPQAINPKTKAVGLIQFMPATAAGLGTSTQELLKMSGNEQLPYVEKYFKPHSGKLNSVEDLYMVTFLPAALNKPDNFVIGVAPGKVGPRGENSNESIWELNRGKLYTQNHVFDLDKKGYYTVGDVKERIRRTKLA